MIAVPVPIKIASTSDLLRCASARDSVPLIHLLVPSWAAARPSILLAHFRLTKGRLFFAAVNHTLDCSSALSAKIPDSTSTPASWRVFEPPAELSPGSLEAKTTLLIPASISATAHGPVFPV